MSFYYIILTIPIKIDAVNPESLLLREKQYLIQSFRHKVNYAIDMSSEMLLIIVCFN